MSRFVSHVIKQVVPLGFFGSESNRKLILDRTLLYSSSDELPGLFAHHLPALMVSEVDIFIGLRRFESLSLHAVLQGFAISECTWLEPENFKTGERVSASDAAKRREILYESLYWLFDSFLIPLLKVRNGALFATPPAERWG